MKQHPEADVCRSVYTPTFVFWFMTPRPCKTSTATFVVQALYEGFAHEICRALDKAGLSRSSLSIIGLFLVPCFGNNLGVIFKIDGSPCDKIREVDDDW